MKLGYWPYPWTRQIFDQQISDQQISAQMSIAAKIIFPSHCFANGCFLCAFTFSAVSDISHLSSLSELFSITHVHSLSNDWLLPWVFSLLPAPPSLIFLLGIEICIFIRSTMLHIELPINTCEITSLTSFQSIFKDLLESSYFGAMLYHCTGYWSSFPSAPSSVRICPFSLFCYWGIGNPGVQGLVFCSRLVQQVVKQVPGPWLVSDSWWQ